MMRPKQNHLSGLHSLKVACLLLSMFLAACASSTPTPVVLPQATLLAPTASAEMDALIAAAQAEGKLVAIALPDDWCNYGELLRNFQIKYGIEVQVLNPAGSSGDELQAVRQWRDTGGGDSPDVLDIGYAFGPQAQAEGLLAPYKVSTWDSIPEALKEPDGYWYGDYYGVLSFEVNANVVDNPPQDWADLLHPEYHDQVALSGDPRSSSQAIMTVYAAALANGGSLDDPLPGLEFFRSLHEAGNLMPIIADAEQVASGQAPITIRWDYLSLADGDKYKDANIQTILPRSGLLGGLYVQAISAYAQHPHAARLWMEYLYSDQGQMLWLKGYCHPVRFNDLVARQMVPQNLMGLLPSAELYNRALFPSLAQLNAAQQMITTRWNDVVGVDIVRP